MAATKINEILNVYKQLVQIPSLTSAKLFIKAEKYLTVQSFWSQRNLEKNKKQKFVQEFMFDEHVKPLVDSFPVDVSSEILSDSSVNEKLKAILREVTTDGKSKQFIEIWDNQRFLKSYDLTALDVHGDIYSHPTFGSFNWSPDNTRLLYVAEKKLPKSEPFYKQKPKPKTEKTDAEEEPSKGTEHVFKPDWGEQLVGKHRSVVVVLNIEQDTIDPVASIPDDYFPAQVIWAPNGNDIVGVAYKLYPRYLGMMFCTNRESYIFHVKGTEFRKLTSQSVSCRSPRFSPDGKHLVWLERDISPPHHNVQRLMQMKWDSAEVPNVLVDVVKTSVAINEGKKFHGFYNQGLPKRCWSDDSKYIFVSTPHRSVVKSYVINLETKAITEINNPEENSLVILDVKKNYVAFARNSPIQPTQLVIGKFNPSASDIDNFHLFKSSNAWTIPNGENLMYENSEFVYNNDDSVKDFNFTYVGTKDGNEKSIPLIAMPHGGPHSAYSNDFFISHILFNLLGYGVLLINYRGSTGMGGDNVEYILGKVGESDVLDCVTAINTALKKYPWLNPGKVNLCGGSHGGFLSAHLSGQHPDMFRSVVMRNPVIDLAAMFSISDIPDWCCGESESSNIVGGPEMMAISNYPDMLLKMLEHSPILHADNVKAPTLISLGSNDLRVPSSQGKLWYYRLKENNVITKLFMYDDNHSLSKDDVEIDYVMNTALWLIEHNEDKTSV